MNIGALLSRPTVRTLFSTVLALGLGRDALAQYTSAPYSEYDWAYQGPLSYNPTYARYGPPGVGVSPWNPIVQAQLNLGMKTARYNMYSGWADWAGAAANLYNQQAMAQAMQNAQQQRVLQPHYDVRQRVPRPAPPPPQSSTPRSLPRNQVLTDDGQVIWPGSAPTGGTLGRARDAAQAAIRVAVKEFEANGRATVQSVAEAKSLLFAYGKPALEEVAGTNRAEAKRLLTFFQSLEQVLNSLAGE